MDDFPKKTDFEKGITIEKIEKAAKQLPSQKI